MTAMQYSQHDATCDGAIYTQKTSPWMFTTSKPGMKQQRIFKTRESAETSGGDNTAVDLAILTYREERQRKRLEGR
jgi:hypothetical protein